MPCTDKCHGEMLGTSGLIMLVSLLLNSFPLKKKKKKDPTLYFRKLTCTFTDFLCPQIIIVNSLNKQEHVLPSNKPSCSILSVRFLLEEGNR